MKALIADQKLVTELLPMEEAIDVMRRALTMLAEGDVIMPLRQMLVMPGGDRVMGLMPSYVGGLEAVGVKVVAAFPANFDTEHIVGEIGEVLTGKAPARTSPDEITLFKSLGIAIEDLAAAHHVYTKAKERELGTWVEIGGRHFGSAVED